MKKKLPLFLFLFVFISCQNKNGENALCDCVEAGQEANRISASFFDREATKAGKDSLDAAIQKRDEICLPFQNMLAQELQEKAKDCENLSFSTEE